MPPQLDHDHETVLVVAGDIWHAGKYYDWLRLQSHRFLAVVCVLGNHDYWNGGLYTEPVEFNNYMFLNDVKNVVLLQNSTFRIRDLLFVGGTLWTDMNRENPRTMLTYPYTMRRDNELIKGKGDQGINADLILSEHIRTKHYIQDHAKPDVSDQSVIVVTHMAPSFKSIDPIYHSAEDYPANYYYFSDLDEQIESSKIKYWFHGHVHSPVRYEIGNTTVISNPRGYYGYERTGYDPKLIIS